MENYTKIYPTLLYAKKAKLVIEETAVVGVCALVNKSVSDGAYGCWNSGTGDTIG